MSASRDSEKGCEVYLFVGQATVSIVSLERLKADCMSSPSYRRKYALLNDRRRTLFELRRLSSRITAHPLWLRSVHVEPELEGHLLECLHAVDHGLAKKVGAAQEVVLQREVQRLYCALTKLAHLWVQLEDAQSLSPR